MSPTKLSLAGNNLVFPARESLVSDITAGDGKIANHLLQCIFCPYFLKIWWSMPLLLDIYFIYRYSIEVDEKIYTYNISVWCLLVVLSTRCGLAACMDALELYC
jgi:hypothetical protein